MSVEMRSRRAAAAVHLAVVDVRPRALAPPRTLVMRRVLIATALGALAVMAAVAVLRSTGARNDEVEDRIANRPKVTAPPRNPEGGADPSRPGPGARPRGKIGSLPAVPGDDPPKSAVGAPARAAAGDRLAVVVESATGAPEIHVMRLGGSDRKVLGPGHEPDWSPDGRRLVYTRGRNQGQCFGVSNDANPEGCEIWVMNADGSDQRRIRGGWDPDWSPDGRRIVFAAGESDAEIYVMDADGSRMRRLTDHDEELSSVSAPDWSPDGRRIAFSRAERNPDQTYRMNNVYVMNADGSGRDLLIGEATDPKWSADGERIAYQRGARGGGGNYEIYTVRLDGSDERRLTEDPETASPMDNYDGNPEWTPDGGIIFARDPDGPTGWSTCYLEDAVPHCAQGGPAPSQLFIMNADGSGRVRIGEGRSASFAPRQ